MDKKLYRVHFSGYYGYDVDVLAESEDEAKEIAEPIFDETDSKEFYFENNGSDCWEDKPIAGWTAYTNEDDEITEKTFLDGEWK